MFVEAEPGAAGAQILAANDMRCFCQGGRRQGRARQVLIAIRGYHNRVVRERLEIDCERAHNHEIDKSAGHHTRASETAGRYPEWIETPVITRSRSHLQKGCEIGCA